MASTVSQFRPSVGITVGLDDVKVWGSNSTNTTTFTASFSVSHGTQADRVDLIYVNQLVVAANTTTTLQVNNGSLIDPHNNALTFARVKLIHVELVSSNPVSALGMTVGAAAANPLVPYTQTLIATVLNTSVFQLFLPGATGIAVSGTVHSFKFQNLELGGGLSQTVRVVIAGCSA